MFFGRHTNFGPAFQSYRSILFLIIRQFRGYRPWEVNYFAQKK